MKEQFFRTINAISPLSAATISELDGCLRAVHYPKNTLVVRQGEHATNMFFICSGAVRAYFYHQDKEYTDWFMFENMFMCAIASFFGDGPSMQHIETLEASDMLVLSRRQIERICDKHPDMQRLNSRILAQSLVNLQQNVIDQRFKTAQERYALLINTYPEVIQRVPLKYIASFLGVTQETLSRIRALIS